MSVNLNGIKYINDNSDNMQIMELDILLKFQFNSKKIWLGHLKLIRFSYLLCYGPRNDLIYKGD